MCILGAFFSMQVFASERIGLRDRAFAEFTLELDRIEGGKHIGTAMAEIEVARKMIGDGRLLFREGSIRKSAIIVERLPVQITLIRAIIGAEAALHDAKKIEHDLRVMRRSLELFQARHTKMLSKLPPDRKGEKK
jgi:hypothetical protein